MFTSSIFLRIPAHQAGVQRNVRERGLCLRRQVFPQDRACVLDVDKKRDMENPQHVYLEKFLKINGKTVTAAKHPSSMYVGVHAENVEAVYSSKRDVPFHLACGGYNTQSVCSREGTLPSSAAIEGWSAHFLCSLEVAVPVFSVSARLCYFVDSENILIKFSAAFCGDRHKNLLLWKALFRVCINCMVYLYCFVLLMFLLIETS